MANKEAAIKLGINRLEKFKAACEDRWLYNSFASSSSSLSDMSKFQLEVRSLSPEEARVHFQAQTELIRPVVGRRANFRTRFYVSCGIVKVM